MKKLLIFALLLLMVPFVLAERSVQLDVFEAIIQENGDVTYTSTPVTNFKAYGYVCSDSSCSSYSSKLYDGNSISSINNRITLTYPTTLQSSNGYAHILGNDNGTRITWAERADWWGTNKNDPQGPFDAYLARVEMCRSPIDSFSVINDAHPFMPVTFNISTSLDATAYSALSFTGPIGFEAENLLSSYEVKTLITLEVRNENNELMHQDSKLVSIHFDDAERIFFTWTPQVVGRFNATITTSVPDEKCVDSTPAQAQKEFSIISETGPYCYALGNGLSAQPLDARPNETVTISTQTLANFVDEFENLNPLPSKLTIDISKGDFSDSIQVDISAGLAEAYQTTLRQYSFPESGLYTIKASINAQECPVQTTHEDIQTIEYLVEEVDEDDPVQENNPPVLFAPDLFFEYGDGLVQNIYDLEDFAFDPEQPSSTLKFTIVEQSNTSVVNCSLQNNNIQCSVNNAGDSVIKIQVEDNESATSFDLVTATVRKIDPNLSIDVIPEANFTQGTVSSVTGLGCPIELSCTLLRNGVVVSNPNIQTLNAGVYTYTFSTQGNNNYNSDSVTKTIAVNLPEEEPDTTPPVIENLAEAPSSPTIYENGKQYSFSAKITDDVELEIVEFIFNGVSQNVERQGDIFSASIFDLSAGTYPYTWTAKDSSGNTAQKSKTYEVVKAMPLIDITFAPSILVGGVSRINQGEQVTVTGTNCPTQLTCQLKKEGVNIQSPFTFMPLTPGTISFTYSTSGNQNYSSFSRIRLLEVMEVVVEEDLPPVLSNPTEHPFPAFYAKNQHYTFTVTATDDKGVAEVKLSFNGNIYTPTKSGDVYSVTIFDLSAGTYQYTWTAKDTSDNTVSLSKNYVVNKASPLCSMNTNSPVTFPQEVKVSATCNNPETEFVLLRGSTDVTNQNNQFVLLNPGTYIYTAKTVQTQNFSLASTQKEVVVNSSELSQGSINLLLNGLAQNMVVTYPQSVTFSAFSQTGQQVKVSIDSVDVTHQNNQEITYGARTYTIKAVALANNQFEEASITRTFTVNKASPNLQLGISPSLTIQEGTQSTALGSSCPSELTCVLRRNNVIVSNPDVQTLSRGTYTYEFSTSGNSNYLPGIVSKVLTVEKDAVFGSIQLTLNGLAQNIVVTYPQSVTPLATSQNQDVVLLRNGNDITALNGAVLELAPGVYNFTAVALANENFKEARVTYFVEVVKATPDLKLSFTPAKTNMFGTQTIVSGSNCPQGLTCTLRRNNLIVSNPDVQTLDVGTYTYTFSTQGNNNYAPASVEETMTVHPPADTTPPQVVLISPFDNSKVSTQGQNFLAEFTDSIALESATLHIWKDSSLIHAQTISLSGTNSIGSLPFTLPGEGSYEWNYLAFDNAGNSAFAPNNFTLNLEKERQLVIELISSNEVTIEGGDTFNAVFKVTCLSAECGDVDVTLKTPSSQVSSFGDVTTPINPRRITLSSGESKEVTFPVTLSQTQGIYEIFAEARTVNFDAFAISNSITAKVVDTFAIIFTANPASGNAPLPVDFSCSAQGGVEPMFFTINTGDGNIISESTAIQTTNTYSAGSFTSTCLVSDSLGRVRMESISINVEETPFFFLETPPGNAHVGLLYYFQLKTSEGGATFTKVQGPAGLTIDPSTGVITWVPQEADLGMHRVTIRANSGAKTAEMTWSIWVTGEEAKADVLHLSQIRFLSGDIVRAGEPLRVSVGLKNDGSITYENTVLTFTVFDLGIRRSAGPFDFENGREETKAVSLDIPYYAMPGEYLLRVTVSEDGRMVRTLHRYFIIQ